MLQFEYPQLADRQWLQPILSATGRMGSENAFGTLYIWRSAYHSKVCKQGDTLFLCSGEHQPSYVFPIGGDLSESLKTILEDAKEKGIPFKMWGMSEQEVQLVEQTMPGVFEFHEDRDSADYIYSAEKLIHLSGRKLHGKRNHLAQFARDYQFQYDDISQENLADCIAIAKEWCKSNGGCDENGLDHEFCALKRSIEHFEALHFAGGLIRIEGKPVAFTLGEEINPKEYILHFEKALNGYNGLYAAINHEYVMHRLSGYQYVNREEDLGIEGLRKAKLSYQPEIILVRYRAVLKG